MNKKHALSSIVLLLFLRRYNMVFMSWLDKTSYEDVFLIFEILLMLIVHIILWKENTVEMAGGWHLLKNKITIHSPETGLNHSCLNLQRDALFAKQDYHTQSWNGSEPFLFNLAERCIVCKTRLPYTVLKQVWTILFFLLTWCLRNKIT